MYQNLYRKYRPKNFDEVCGQEIIIKTLKNAVINDKISHAYLFVGPRGTGKTSVAKILAKIINCHNLKDLIPCDKCDSCIEINEKRAIDILEIDAASNNGVDEIRELNNKINLVPNYGKYKVYIIDEVHMLTIGAFNALLKTLEEPPKHAIFILATTEPHKIPTTILSRCQRFDFKKINSEKMNQYLANILKKEKIDFDNRALEEIIKLSDGGMRDALSLLDKVISYSNGKINLSDIYEVSGLISEEEIIDFIYQINSKNIKEIFDKIDLYDQDGKNFIRIVESIIYILRDVLINQNTDKINVKYEKIKMNNEELYNTIKQLTEVFNMMKINDDPRLILEISIIKLIGNDNFDLKKENLAETKDVENPIKETIKTLNNETKQDIKQEDETKKNIEMLAEIRVNNTLCNFDKKAIKIIKEAIADNDLCDDKSCAELYMIIKDCNLKAASDKNIIFVCETKLLAYQFNENLYYIDKMMKSKMKLNYKSIFVDKKTWEEIKDQFNNKKKKFEYEEEPKGLINKKINNNIEKIFDEIVEYD